MDINALKKMSYEEVRHLYMPFLQSQGVGPNTIKTAYVDSFYLWRKGDHDLFWKAVESNDADAKAMLLDALRKNTTGDAEKLVSGISFPPSQVPALPRIRRDSRAEDGGGCIDKADGTRTIPQEGRY